jgi:hypothetical protein
MMKMMAMDFIFLALLRGFVRAATKKKKIVRAFCFAVVALSISYGGPRTNHHHEVRGVGVSPQSYLVLPVAREVIRIQDVPMRITVTGILVSSELFRRDFLPLLGDSERVTT